MVGPFPLRMIVMIMIRILWLTRIIRMVITTTTTQRRTIV